MKLEQIASITAGYPFRTKIPEVADTGVVAVQMKDISLNKAIHWPSCVETELTGKRKPDWLKSGDILFVARGSNYYAVLVDDSVAGRRAVAAPHFYVISCKKKEMLPEYLVWLLNQEPCHRYFQREAEGTFTKSIRRSVLEEIPIAMPSIAKQRSIIQIANTLKQEQQLIEELIRNGEILMNTIATKLLKDSQKVHGGT